MAQGWKRIGATMGWVALGLVAQALIVAPAGAEPRHGVAMHGAPKYGPSFTHFDYVRPDAPKGGEVRMAATGSFDSLNPFLLKGVPAAGTRQLFDSLMVSSEDEAMSQYGLIAESIDIAADRRSVTFRLRPQARFHDRSPITAADVVFSLEILRSKGHPQYRFYYTDVDKAEALDPHTVRFTFKTDQNRELPLIVGQLPVLSQAYYSKQPFDQTTFEPPLGSGPYKVATVDRGRSIAYQLDPDYWAKDLPVNRGRHNFGVMRYDYYRDYEITLEALKAGEIDLRQEATAKNWVGAYDVPAVKDGRLIQLERPNALPRGMQGFYYNSRKPIFQDRRVREALSYGFDFEWANKTLFFGKYKRTRSYFDNTELAARGLPSPEELALLTPLKDQLPPELFTTEYNPPVSDGPGGLRENFRKALALLAQAGWTINKDGKLAAADGQLFEFEILLSDPRMERVSLPFAENLKRLGVTAKVRSVDPAQYQRRMDEFDFDVVVGSAPQSVSPGNEQRDYWTSAAALTPGGRNILGIKSPAVDRLVEAVIQAEDRAQLVTAVRALDRALTWGHYVTPHYHLGAYWIAHWNMFGQPQIAPAYGMGFDSWWVDEAKLARLGDRRRAAPAPASAPAPTK